MITIDRFAGRLHGRVNLTPSKSITNRVLIIRALSKNNFEIINQATASDSVILKNALNSLPSHIDVKDAGTACRFLTAYLSCQPGEFTITGTDRMKQRPIGSLVNALWQIGADIRYTEKENFIPLKISGKKLEGGKIQVDASLSSQFVSALMLIAPVLPQGLSIEMNGHVASEPYIQMTADVMRRCGVEVQFNENFIRIGPGEYSAKEFTVENDWSAASFWYALVSMTDEAEIILAGLSERSMQGDSVVAKIMEQFGVETQSRGNDILIRKTLSKKLTHFHYDFSNCPDLVIPIAVACAGEKVLAEFTGVENLRLKESDRLAAIKTELEKTGSRVEIGPDLLKIIPGEMKSPGTIHSHGDHRIVMAFAALAMKTSIRIDDENVVAKSYPEFWDQLRQCGLKIQS